jgi:hypothetical protein
VGKQQNKIGEFRNFRRGMLGTLRYSVGLGSSRIGGVEGFVLNGHGPPLRLLPVGPVLKPL